MHKELRDKIRRATEGSGIEKPDFLDLLQLIDQHYDQMEATITQSLTNTTPMEAIFDSVSDALFTVSESGIVCNCNKVCAHFFGLTRDQLMDALGDVVYVELPEEGQTVSAGDEAGVVESVKAASDIYSPVSGTVVAINAALDDEPEKVNQDPYGDGWFFKVEPDDAGELDELLDAEGYQEVCEDEG